MNEGRAGVFTGMRRRGDGFACEISTSPEWMDHERAALAFVDEFAPQISQARKLGADVTIDMALAVAGFERPIECVRFGPRLLQALGAREVALEVTVYTGLPFERGPSPASRPE